MTSLQKLTAEAQRAQSFTLAYSLRPLRLGGEMTFLQETSFMTPLQKGFLIAGTAECTEQY